LACGKAAYHGEEYVVKQNRSSHGQYTREERARISISPVGSPTDLVIGRLPTRSYLLKDPSPPYSTTG
jgi:hypothetical protein